MKITRRDFLRTAALSVAYAATSKGENRAPDERRVLVLGAGLGGLAAAYELKKAGFEVTVLEARSHAGGRVLTYRDAFADGLYAEMGAEYVDASDEFDHRYCKEFGLTVLTAKLYDAIFVRNKIFRMASFKQNREALPFEGTKPGVLFGQEAEYTRKLLSEVRDPTRLPEAILELDKVSAKEILLMQGAPPDVIALFTYLNATEETARPEQMSALSMLKSHLKQSAFSEVQNEGRILGGNDQLPKMFARKLADKILYNRAVRKIAHHSNGVEVWFNEHGTIRSMQAPWLVIAIPFSVLRTIEISPAFSESKMRCIQDLSYGHVMKTAMQYRERFWDRQESPGQRVFTDTKLRRIYHMSIDQPGPRGILMSFTSAKDAEDLGKLGEIERLKIAREEVARIWPESTNHWEGGITKYWNEDPWTKASYSFTGVGQERDSLDLARKQEGRVFFAGEHTSPFRASMNGAIESGVRACREILART